MRKYKVLCSGLILLIIMTACSSTNKKNEFFNSELNEHCETSLKSVLDDYLPVESENCVYNSGDPLEDNSGLLTNIFTYETEYDEMAKESEYIGKLKILGIKNGSLNSDVSTCKCKVEVLVKGEHLGESEDGTIFIDVMKGIVSVGESYIIGFDKTDDNLTNYIQTPKTYIYGFREDLIRKIIGRCVYFRTGKVTENYLIPATGRDGTEGYIWDDDLAPTPKTIEEAIELTKKASTEQIIPLYNLYGDVIGEYVIGAVTVKGIEEILDEMNY